MILTSLATRNQRQMRLLLTKLRTFSVNSETVTDGLGMATPELKIQGDTKCDCRCSIQSLTQTQDWCTEF